jgi:hypothetical protein
MPITLDIDASASFLAGKTLAVSANTGQFDFDFRVLKK